MTPAVSLAGRWVRGYRCSDVVPFASFTNFYALGRVTHLAPV
jgi:hypothetical protein